MTSTRALLILCFAVALASVRFVNGQSCNSHNSDPNACSGVLSQSCTYDAATAVCFTSIAPCANQNTTTLCGARSDCATVNDTMNAFSYCKQGQSGCGLHLTIDNCPNTCYWDMFAPVAQAQSDSSLMTNNKNLGVYVGQCVNSMYEVTDAIAGAVATLAVSQVLATTGDYNCSHWTAYPVDVSGLDACFKHGCTRAASGNDCTTVALAPAYGQSCGQVFAPSTNYTVCSNIPEFCSFDSQAGQCLNGAPTLCEQLYSNKHGCSTFGPPGTCAFNALTNRCVTPPKKCAQIFVSPSSPTLTDIASCGARSDCTVSTSGVGATCVVSTSGCSIMPNATACVQNYCFWDATVMLTSTSTLGHCFNSAAEVSGNKLLQLAATYQLLAVPTPVVGTFPCSTWSGTADTLSATDACRSHGCQRTPGSVECTAFTVPPTSTACSLLINTSLQSDAASCFELDNYCHWSATASAICMDMAPTTCEQFAFDAAGCAAFNGTQLTAKSGACGWNTLSGMCFTVPKCGYLTNAQCASTTRVDCAWNSVTGTCAHWDVSSNACGSLAQSACASSSSCFWDPYVTIPQIDGLSGTAVSFGITGSTSDSKSLTYAGTNNAGTPNGVCFNSINEVNSEYSCSHWESYYTGMACQFHGCALNNGKCTSASTTGSAIVTPAYTLTTDFEFTILNETMSTTAFTANVVIPIASFFQPATPVLYIIAVGAATVSPANTFQSPSVCSSVMDSNNTQTKSFLPSTRQDTTALWSEFLAAISNNQLGGAMETASVMAVVGNWKIGPNSVVKSVSRTTTLDITNTVVDAISFAVSVDVTPGSAFASCITSSIVLDASGQAAGTSTTVPLSVIQVTSSSLVPVVAQFTMAYTTHGTVEISDTTNTALSVSMVSSEDTTYHYDAGNNQVLCPAGYKARHWVMREVFANYDSTMRTGVKSAMDVTVTNGGCYGTSVLPITNDNVTCSGLLCTTLISFQSVCTPVTAGNPQVFSTCSSDIWAGSVKGNQSFTSQAYSWLASGGFGTTSLRPVHLAADGVSAANDVIKVSLVFPTYLDSFASVVLTAQLGLLSSPGNTLGQLTDSTKYTASNQGANTTGIRYLNDDFTPIVQLTDAKGISSFTLQLNLSSITITPLASANNADGTFIVISNVAPIGWSQIKSSVIKTARLAQAECQAIGCVLLDIVSANKYIDGFSIPVSVLRALLPANGYRVSMSWNAVSNSRAGSRRLLAFDGDSQTPHQGQTNVVIMVGPAPADALSLPPPQVQSPAPAPAPQPLPPQMQPLPPQVQPPAASGIMSGGMPGLQPCTMSTNAVPLQASTVSASNWSFWSTLLIVIGSFASSSSVTLIAHRQK